MLFTSHVILAPEHEHYRSRITFSNGYATIDKKYLHRILMNAPSDEVVDHINGNPLDNRVNNLRICSQGQNSCNRAKTFAKRTSKYKGVSWRKSHSKWQATIYVDKRQLHIGYYDSEEQAALMYDIAAKKYHKEFSYQNFSLELA
jgi:AP2 domain/HNH endonuclease